MRGARLVLDEGSREVGLTASDLEGYEIEVGGHLEVAEAIAAGRANVGSYDPVGRERLWIGVRAAARRALRRRGHWSATLIQRPVKAMLDALNSNRFAREVSRFCAYDTDQMGRTLARIA